MERTDILAAGLDALLFTGYLCLDDVVKGANFWLESKCKEEKVDKCLTTDEWVIYNSGEFNLKVSLSCGKYLQYQIQSNMYKI